MRYPAMSSTVNVRVRSVAAGIRGPERDRLVVDTGVVELVVDEVVGPGAARFVDAGRSATRAAAETAPVSARAVSIRARRRLTTDRIGRASIRMSVCTRLGRPAGLRRRVWVG